VIKKLGKDNFEIKILDELELKNKTEKEIEERDFNFYNKK